MTFLSSYRNVVNDVGSQCLECLHQHSGGGLAIHVEVPPDADPLLAAHGCANDLYSFCNSRERRRWQRVGVQEGARRFRRVDAALEESLRDQRRQVEVRESGGNFYRRRVDPASHVAEILPLVAIISS